MVIYHHHILDTVADNLNTEPGNIDEKAKQVDIVEPKLEIPTQIDESGAQRKYDKDWLDKFLAGIENTKPTIQELNDKVVVAVLS